MLAIATINNQLALTEHPIPQPAAGQLLIKVAAAGVNRADLMQAQGKYPPPAGESEILGLEIAGTIAALGEGVTGWQVGDAVLALVGGGAYAEYCLVDQSLCCLQPDILSHAKAASLPEVWMTAWLNLIDIGQLKAGQRVLIHAGASGVGAAAIQLAKSVGAWVAVTTSTPEKQAFSRDLGADLVIDYRAQDFATEIKAAGGVDLILDTVGGDYLASNQRCLNADGLIIVIGLLRGIESQLNLGLMLVKRQRIQGSALRSQPLSIKAKLTQALRSEILPRIASGEFKVTLDRTFAMADAQAAHDYVAANRNSGKVVLLNAAN
ncbi:NAD(P)H-quinone oxidoreductase [Deefgea tanakiae]|uniref:NAD(P)H-quinone oxidoreductase n=1 Tax=Deefgea tanakiae TaxID=2865840 RepID=A0ABX8Z7P4_9NEIS|nr:NAD(P)H-quinone oxidoreductase [Deefgea tanakiae]QZA78581.1 NAD(P)H-quinone oxidoreductase [Deefgea tanakiae]